MSHESIRSDSLRDAVERAYSTFARYARPALADFCTYCWDEREIAYLRSTELRTIDEEHARRLAWESADHWADVYLYKHYLPRILDALAPPERCDDLYPVHLFGVLNAHRFAGWPEDEKRAVMTWILAVRDDLERTTPDDLEEWCAAAATLRTNADEM